MAAAGKEKTSLGRGLATLLGDAHQYTRTTGSAAGQTVPVDKLRPNPMQPRRDFDTRSLEELTESVREKGIIQPLIIRPDPERDGGYMIVAGERRWRAAQQAQLHDIPVVIRELSDTESLEYALVENIQRSDLNPMEEALAYRQLIDRFGHTQEKLSAAVGKSRSFIANLLRLLNLPEDVQQLVRDGRLTAGHARALVVAEDPSAIAQTAVNLSLSVRQTEELVKRSATGGTDAGGGKNRKDANTRVLEASLSAALRAKVSIDLSRKGESGRVVVGFKNLEHLDELCAALRKAGTGIERAGS